MEKRSAMSCAMSAGSCGGHGGGCMSFPSHLRVPEYRWWTAEQPYDRKSLNKLSKTNQNVALMNSSCTKCFALYAARLREWLPVGFSRATGDTRLVVNERPRCRWFLRGSGCISKVPFCSVCGGRWRPSESPRSHRLRCCAQALPCVPANLSAPPFLSWWCRDCGYLTCCLQSAAGRLSWRSGRTPSSTRSRTAPQTWSRLLQETHNWRWGRKKP